MTAPEKHDLCGSLVGGFRLGDHEFDLLREFVHAQTGIALGGHKRDMLRARLNRRLRALGLATFADYHELLRDHDPAGQELTRFIHAVTTRVTEFFREGHHFHFLTEKWVPQLRESARHEGQRRLRIWSAGCSTGEEPYTIAMVLREALGAGASSWDVRILASDIDDVALKQAAAGVYPIERVAAVPAPLLKRSFLRGIGANAGLVRARPEIQELIAFRRINFIEAPWPIHACFDAIFCRNVLIYFDRPTQQRVLQRMLGFLRPGGLLFLGHSESLHGLFAGMKHRESTIYQSVGGNSTEVSSVGRVS